MMLIADDTTPNQQGFMAPLMLSTDKLRKKVIIHEIRAF